MKWDALEQLWLFLHELKVLFLGTSRFYDRETFDRCVVGAAHLLIVEVFVFGEFNANARKVLSGEKKKLALFERLDVVGARLLMMKAFEVADPPIFEGKVDDDFLCVIIDHISAEASSVHVGGSMRNLTRSEIVLLLANNLHLQEADEEFHFFVTEVGKSSQ